MYNSWCGRPRTNSNSLVRGRDSLKFLSMTRQLTKWLIIYHFLRDVQKTREHSSRSQSHDSMSFYQLYHYFTIRENIHDDVINLKGSRGTKPGEKIPSWSLGLSYPSFGPFRCTIFGFSSLCWNTTTLLELDYHRFTKLDNFSFYWITFYITHSIPPLTVA